VQPVLHTLEREPLTQARRGKSTEADPGGAPRVRPHRPKEHTRRRQPAEPGDQRHRSQQQEPIFEERREQQRDQCPQRLHSVARLELVERVAVAIEQVPRRRREVDRVIDDDIGDEDVLRLAHEQHGGQQPEPEQQQGKQQGPRSLRERAGRIVRPRHARRACRRSAAETRAS
jgi:hypothetical protein